jgi:hypothetical protein
MQQSIQSYHDTRRIICWSQVDYKHGTPDDQRLAGNIKDLAEI